MGGFESRARAMGYRRVAGVDEAGRGPLAGPVVAAAVVLPPDFPTEGLDDSKALSPAARDRAFSSITSGAAAWAVAAASPGEIDRLNVLHASLLAMRRAVEALSPPPDFVFVDGDLPVLPSGLCPYRPRRSAGRRPRRPLPGLLFRAPDGPPGCLFAAEAGCTGEGRRGRGSIWCAIGQEPVVGGDGLCLSIMAASILAKVSRDRLMEEYDRLHPGYGFAAHKGYPTREHLAALRRLGPSPIHRRTFRGVRTCP